MDRSDTYNIILGGQEMGRKGALTDEHKRKLSEAHKGKTPWNKGKRVSDEQKRKLSDAHKGKPTWLSTHMKQVLPNGPVNKKPVSQYTMDGKLIATYKSITDAKRITGISTIGLCCKGKARHGGGFIWRYDNGK